MSRLDGSLARPARMVNEKLPDTVTIMSISVVVWSLFAVLHEIVGHGGTALLLGEDVRGAVTTTVHIADFYDVDRVAGRIGWWGFRTVAAGGTVINFLTGALALALLGSGRILDPTLRYFLWFFGTVSFLQQAFWLAVMPFAGLGGDWTAFFVNLEPATRWRVGVSALGALLLWMACWLPIRLWKPAIGAASRDRRRQIRRLTVIPVLAAFAVQLLSVSASPLSGARHTTLVSAFSFIPLLLWLIPVGIIRWPCSMPPPEVASPGRRRFWLVAGALSFILFVFVLGPGVGSFAGHPAYEG